MIMTFSDVNASYLADRAVQTWNADKTHPRAEKWATQVIWTGRNKVFIILGAGKQDVAVYRVRKDRRRTAGVSLRTT